MANVWSPWNLAFVMVQEYLILAQECPSSANRPQRTKKRRAMFLKNTARREKAQIEKVIVRLLAAAPAHPAADQPGQPESQQRHRRRLRHAPSQGRSAHGTHQVERQSVALWTAP